MTYKETLFFVGKCLTITHEEENRKIVEQKIIDKTVDWDSVVKLSTGHYVFPALYCNLKRAGFLHHLPNDLVGYMEYITNLNRERNQQIIEQAKEINELLLTNNITPIFLKGTGNLLEGLYEDISERMVGDIDFIISPKEYEKTISILHQNNYSPVVELKYDFPSFKHYPRIQHPNKIAGVEIHKQMVIKDYSNEFNYNYIKNKIQQIGNVNVLSYSDQLCLSIIAKQINDDGLFFNDIALRNAYDVFLLSKKTIAKNSFNKFKKLKSPLNTFLALCYVSFGNINSLDFHTNKHTQYCINLFLKILNDNNYRQKHYAKQKKSRYFKSRFKIFYQSIYDNKIRFWLFKRLTDKEFKKQLKNLD
ncbi:MULTISPECIES: nucleotidyltransferase family protein [Tenacibaculum]|uniref:nucleotidyltransferase family protein n=1 Tax=Tenacibaculum TaxID=104267 RepID=UPI000DE85048|nr:nucleotidyltransferase family protein [Tenacibaculum sp. E3R01]RBW58105.1 hypothetical protein DS884_09575 [Tenacibaculum sp. E3R01]